MIIDNHEQYVELLENVGNTDIIIIPIFSDVNYHVLDNTLSALYIYLINDQKDYFLLFDHDEKLYEATDIFDILSKTGKNIFVFNKKELMHLTSTPRLIDINLISYLSTNKKITLANTLTSAHTFLYSKYFDRNRINTIVPAVKHLETCRTQKDIAIDVLLHYEQIIEQPYFKIYNEKVLENYCNIEKSGMKVDSELFDTHYQEKNINYKRENNIIYSEYNPYTATGRPANSFGGINFAAFNKDDGSRKMLRSRFDDGILIEFDYSSYHLMLIADIIGYKLPPDCNIHEYLGKQYLGKDTLTEEEHNSCKELNFKLIYGGIYKEFEEIPYFKQTKDYIYNVWKKYIKQGYIESKLFGRRIYCEDASKETIFNYFIQNFETEHNNIILHKIFECMKQFDSKLILYVYDSFLFDVPKSEAKLFVNTIKPIITRNEKYPVIMKIGYNYQEMESYGQSKIN